MGFTPRSTRKASPAPEKVQESTTANKQQFDSEPVMPRKSVSFNLAEAKQMKSELLATRRSSISLRNHRDSLMITARRPSLGPLSLAKVFSNGLSLPDIVTPRTPVNTPRTSAITPRNAVGVTPRGIKAMKTNIPWLDHVNCSYSLNGPRQVITWLWVKFGELFMIGCAVLSLLPVLPYYLYRVLAWIVRGCDATRPKLGLHKGKKEVIVIGGGTSGIVCCKEMTQEGHLVKVFEKSNKHGGVFSRAYTGCFTSCNINTAFGDFTKHHSTNPEKWRFQTFNEYCDYLRAYMKHFGISKKITFNTEVLSTEFCEESRRWTVRVRDCATKVVTTHTSDVLVVACGTHGVPKDLPIDESKFTGEKMHSYQYKDPKIMRGKNVVVYGLGESASDVAYQCSAQTKVSIISRRGPGVVIPRYSAGLPSDHSSSRLYHSWPRVKFLNATKFVDTVFYYCWKIKIAFEGLYATQGDMEFEAHTGLMDYTRYSWQNRFGTKSAGFIYACADNGAQYYESEIVALEGKEAVLKNGERVPCDVLINCTGYKDAFPFLPAKAQKWIDEKTLRNLYLKTIVPPYGGALQFLGFARPAVGNIPTISEMMSRHNALVTSGKITLPSQAQMELEADAVARYEIEQFTEGIIKPKTTLIDYSLTMVMIARKFGCQPDFWKLMFTDPHLCLKMATLSMVPMGWRVHGPKADYEASRKVIMAAPWTPVASTAWTVVVWNVSRMMMVYTPFVFRESRRALQAVMPEYFELF